MGRRLTKEEKEIYMKKEPIGVLALNNSGGIEVLDFEYGIEDYVIIRWFNNRLHRLKVYYKDDDSYFAINGMRFYFSTIMTVRGE